MSAPLIPFVEEKNNEFLNINDIVIKNPPATFFMRVEGNSMEKERLFSGDILVIDRSLQVKIGSLVVAFFDGEMIVKRLEKKEAVFGVVTHIIHKCLF